MTTQQIALLRTSFAQLVPIADGAASLFYAHLFHRDPSLRAVPRRHGAPGASPDGDVIGWAVERLDRPDALLQTLQAGLGSAFTSELRAAWVTMYDVVAGAMQAGERAARAQPAAAAA